MSQLSLCLKTPLHYCYGQISTTPTTYYVYYSVNIHTPFIFISISIHPFSSIRSCRIMAASQVPAASVQPPTQNASSVVPALLIGNLPLMLTCYWLVERVASRQHIAAIKQPDTHAHSFSFNVAKAGSSMWETHRMLFISRGLYILYPTNE